MGDLSLKTIKFINAQLLGRKRPTIEVVAEDQTALESSPVSMTFLSTETTEEREQVLADCQDLYESLKNTEVTLLKEFHKKYLDYPFNNALPKQMKALDASQPWILYWIACSLRLMDKTWLGEPVQRKIYAKIFAASLEKGPFCGGMGQDPHLVCTYAAINSLALCDSVDDCWSQINRQAIYDWLLSLKCSNSGFKTGVAVGECDSRSTYCALSVAKMLNILTTELCEGVEGFLLGCQTYEGGFGACPQEDEAHGGYTFCATAGLSILNSLHKCNILRLAEWCSARQTAEEKGFSGRSNKLVDGCYSYWVGAVNSLLEIHGYGSFIDKGALQEYILKCCQSSERPGLRDKPGKSPDYYHTTYVLMGFSLTEHLLEVTKQTEPISVKSTTNGFQLEPVNPVFGLPAEDVTKFIDFMSQLPQVC
ncbi:LAME_0E05402g1_1 [Lachancea meyersii CBS 8951]|uniref:Protein farnesyltransferase subunit beta n=1 Tax=Lachancea meyersii CBS 8951 TaxID=1266667 RepID=A0A1G4JH92_9SACH|nr:LAME_0E05402g1_1 [Lachancea meyersii CBS 8951]